MLNYMTTIYCLIELFLKGSLELLSNLNPVIWSTFYEMNSFHEILSREY